MWVLERGGSSEIICSAWPSNRRWRSERLLVKFPTTAWFGVGGLPPRHKLLWPCAFAGSCWRPPRRLCAVPFSDLLFGLAFRIGAGGERELLAEFPRDGGVSNGGTHAELRVSPTLSGTEPKSRREAKKLGQDRSDYPRRASKRSERARQPHASKNWKEILRQRTLRTTCDHRGRPRESECELDKNLAGKSGTDLRCPTRGSPKPPNAPHPTPAPPHDTAPRPWATCHFRDGQTRR